MAGQPFKVKAIYDYSSPHDDDLSFPNGQVITVTEEEDSEWYIGEYVDQEGIKQDGLFPRNFVERYEPAAPPRPSRPRPKKDQPTPMGPETQTTDALAAPSEDIVPSNPAPLFSQGKGEAESSPAEAHLPQLEQLPNRRPTPARPAANTQAPAPATAEKPSGNSFKDRIAAFNKPTAPPVAPKPSAPAGGSTFIKKPFVAPPPSRSAYVPPPQQSAQPQKIYKREEDPEVADTQAQAQRNAEEVGLAGGNDGEAALEAPKTTSLKERIALLQQQQQEQATRKADAGSKEKPRRPAKPRNESEHRQLDTDEQPPVPSNTAPEPLQRQSSTSSLDAPSSPIPQRPSRHPVEPSLRDIASDGNDADQSGAGETTEEAGASSTEVDDSDDRPSTRARAIPSRDATGGVRNPIAVDLDQMEDADARQMPARNTAQQPDYQDDEEEEEEEEVDPEIRRKAELRERMAKMSGGMGMAGMFGGGVPGASSAPKRPVKDLERRISSQDASSPPPTQRMPMIPVSGISKPQSPLVEDRELQVEKEPEAALPATVARPPEEVPDVEDVEPQPSRHAHENPQFNEESSMSSARPLPTSTLQDANPLPSIPVGRAAPATRAVPPPPPPRVDEGQDIGAGITTTADRRISSGAPPVPATISPLPQRQTSHGTSKRISNPPLQSQPLASSPPTAETRTSRAPPPPPISSPQMLPAGTTDARPPPPPPPPSALPPSRRSTGRELPVAPDDGGSEYEGDYDTDIASGTHHKNALKAHERPSSIDESTLSEDTFSPPSQTRPNLPPPVPPTQRAAPPPPPHQGLSQPRRSADVPRAPPPMPPPQGMPTAEEQEEYDPYRSSGPPPQSTASRVQPRSPVVQESDPTLYDASPTEERHRELPALPPANPPPPQRQSIAASLPPEPIMPPSGFSDPRLSSDTSRPSMEPSPRSTTITRRSIDPGSRPAAGDGQIARDVDLAEDSGWWTQPNKPPPVFQGRPDVLLEFEETSSSKRGGRTTTAKDIFILFQDYSQTVITARYDPRDAANTSQLEQRHESPPPRLRQDQLEAAHARFGASIADFAGNKLSNGTILGDGTPQSLIVELLRSAAPTALLPIGTRAYGALVYTNLANATISQQDGIRPGDVVSFRNARFQGKHGAMHAKYAVDVGKPDHVAVVQEWDGTKKKLRAWEQGREGPGKKGRLESHRLGDLRSGEVKVWRVVGRDWVGWEGES